MMNAKPFDPNDHDEDWIGNNAAFRCQACIRRQRLSSSWWSPVSFLSEEHRTCGGQSRQQRRASMDCAVKLGRYPASTLPRR